MSKFKRHFWMATVLSGAMALPAFGGPVIPSTSQQLDPNMPKHGMETRIKQGDMTKNQGVSSMGKLQQADAHTLWLLHKIDQTEIAAAQLAQAKSQNDKVKDLAGDLLKDHQSLDDDVMKLAQKNGLQFEGAATTATSGEEGTGGSGVAGTTTGSMKMNGDHVPAAPDEQVSGSASSQDTSKDQAIQNGGASQVEVEPNSGTGGSGAANAQASASTSSGSMSAQGTAATGVQGTAMKLSSQDQAMLRMNSHALQKLSKLQGTQFDHAFTRMMAKDHQKAISLLESAQPQNDDVKSLVKDTLPKLQDHEKMAREAMQSLGHSQASSGEQNNTRSNVPSWAPNQTGTATGGSGAAGTTNPENNAAITGEQNNGSSKGDMTGSPGGSSNSGQGNTGTEGGTGGAGGSGGGGH